MSYQHSGNAWTDIVTADSRHIYCDGCEGAAREELRERFSEPDEEGLRMSALTLARRHVLVGYFTPDYDDICDTCGVVAANQHQETE